MTYTEGILWRYATLYITRMNSAHNKDVRKVNKYVTDMNQVNHAALASLFCVTDVDHSTSHIWIPFKRRCEQNRCEQSIKNAIHCNNTATTLQQHCKVSRTLCHMWHRVMPNSQTHMWITHMWRTLHVNIIIHMWKITHLNTDVSNTRVKNSTHVKNDPCEQHTCEEQHTATHMWITHVWKTAHMWRTFPSVTARFLHIYFIHKNKNQRLKNCLKERRKQGSKQKRLWRLSLCTLFTLFTLLTWVLFACVLDVNDGAS